MQIHKSLQKLFKTILSQKPSTKLIRSTAKQEWRLILIILISSLVEAFSEGATLAVIYLAVKLLSTSGLEPVNWQTVPILNLFPRIAFIFNSLSPSTLFTIILGIAVVLQALQSFTSFLGIVSTGYFSARCRALVTTLIHKQVLSLSFSCSSFFKVGDLIDYAATGVDAIVIEIEQSSQLFISFLLIASYLIVLMSISPWLLFAATMIVCFLLVAQHLLQTRIQNTSVAVSQIQVGINSYMTENFQGLRLLHTSGQLDKAHFRLKAWMGDLEKELRLLSLKLSLIGPILNFLPIFTIAIFSLVSMSLIGVNNNIILPNLVVFVISLQRLNQRLSLIAANCNLLAANTGRILRLNEILSTENKQFRRLGGLPYKPIEKGIRFDGVSLRYSDESTLILSKISFCLPKSHTVALVGPSGSGKSSIADLLTGLYEPSIGNIWIDDTPLCKLDLVSWQQNIGVVSQDTFLLNASILENVAFAFPNATREQVEVACKAAQAAGFINSLPKGYHTIVGERGYRLSGGQRQRLSLARAILRDPDLLILDEATSSLDSRNERHVQQAIENFGKGRTVLIIAHRLSTIMHADRILVIDKGHIIESGNHHSLLSQDGLYSQLWQKHAS